VLLITGTGTGVGKTVTTAALAGAALAAGWTVCVVKPVQTGVGPGEDGDLAEVRRLLGGPDALRTVEFVRLPAPMAPQAAARLVGAALSPVAGLAERIRALAAAHDLVLVEGAGGLLVRLDAADGTLATLAGLIPGSSVVLVVEPGLGTLNATELTVEALRARRIPVAGLVIGRWPADPGPVELANLADLPALTGVPVLGVLPAGPELPPTLRPASVLGSRRPS
jgi:dethiobiotin synthetase